MFSKLITFVKCRKCYKFPIFSYSVHIYKNSSNNYHQELNKDDPQYFKKMVQECTTLIDSDMLPNFDEINDILVEAANGGYPKAQFLLGMMYAKKSELEKETKSSSTPSSGQDVMKEIKSIQISSVKNKKSKRQNESTSSSILSSLSYSELSEYWIRQAVQNRDGKAMCYLANKLLLSDQKDDILEAIQLYDNACNKVESQIEALFNLGSIYLEGNNIGEIDKNEKLSFQYFLAAANIPLQPHQIASNTTITTTSTTTHSPTSSTTNDADSSLSSNHIHYQEVSNSNGDSNISNTHNNQDSISINSSANTIIYKEVEEIYDADSCYYIGYCFATGDNGCPAIDPIFALQYLHRAVLAGHPKAYYYIACIYRSGLSYQQMYNSIKDDDHSDSIQIDSSSNMVDTQISTNNMNITTSQVITNENNCTTNAPSIDTKDISKNTDLFTYYLLKAIELDDETAYYCLADILWNGDEDLQSYILPTSNDTYMNNNTNVTVTVSDTDDSNINPDKTKIMHNTKSPVIDKSTIIQLIYTLNTTNIHFMKYNIKLHTQSLYHINKKSALLFYRIASDLGQVDAIVSLAAIYYHGHTDITLKNYRQSFELYNLAAEKGSKEAWRNLASMYYLGEGVEKCEDTARHIMKTIFHVNHYDHKNKDKDEIRNP